LAPEQGALQSTVQAVGKAYDESKHQRHPSGSDKGGQFAPKAGGDDVAERHRRAVARQTAQMPEAMRGVMGGEPARPGHKLQQRIRQRSYKQAKQLLQRIKVGQVLTTLEGDPFKVTGIKGTQVHGINQRTKRGTWMLPQAFKLED
jgi:hypothetical protein